MPINVGIKKEVDNSVLSAVGSLTPAEIEGLGPRLQRAREGLKELEDTYFKPGHYEPPYIYRAQRDLKRTILAIVSCVDPLGLLLCMMHSGHYTVEMQWIKDRNGLSLHRPKTLWKCNLFLEEIEKKDLLAVMFPRDVNFAHDGLGRSGLIDTDFDGFSRADFTPYHNYPEQLNQEATGRRGEGPDNRVSDGLDIEHDDFIALSNITSELGPRLDMIHRTMDLVFQGRTFASLDPFHTDRDFVPLVHKTD